MTRQEESGTYDDPAIGSDAAISEVAAPLDFNLVDDKHEESTDSLGVPAKWRKELWPAVSWMYSLALPVAIWLALVSALVTTWTSTETVTFRVIDQVTNAPVGNADLVVSNAVYRTDENGEVRIKRPATNESISVRADGYVTVTGEWTNLAGDHQEVPIRPEDANAVGWFAPAAPI